MAKNISSLLENYFKNHLIPFSGDEFRQYLLENKIRVSPEEIAGMLYNNDFVFALQNNQFITRAGTFTNRVFSFKPTLEEVNAGVFVPGHRFMPFLNPAVYPYEAAVMVQEKFVEKKTVELSTNTALDIHSLLGEGYIIPYLFDDPSNENFNIQSFQQNSLPKTLKLTGFSLQPLLDAGFKHGDRVLCRVVDWGNSVVELTFMPWSNTSTINAETIERNQWYKDFEDGMLRLIDKLGPCSSIEAQLSYLFLEEQSNLCIMNCGSCEEFLKYTKKIGFKPYGVESRIWKTDESIPYIGNWNKELADANKLPEIENLFNEKIYDAFIKNEIYLTNKNPDLDKLAREIIPSSLRVNEDELKFLLLNLKKRTSIILKNYTKFNDIEVAAIRQRLIKFFSRVRDLMCGLAVSELDLREYSSDSLIMMNQIADHVVRMIEEMEIWPYKISQQEAEINVSLDGMIETFNDIELDLKIDDKEISKSGFKLV